MFRCCCLCARGSPAPPAIPFSPEDASAVIRCVGYGPDVSLDKDADASADVPSVPAGDDDATFETADLEGLFPPEAVTGSEGGSIRYQCRLHSKREKRVLQDAVDAWNSQSKLYSMVRGKGVEGGGRVATVERQAGGGGGEGVVAAGGVPQQPTPLLQPP
jgi:hypothetical protein